MTDLLACSQIFINLQAMECHLADGYSIEIIRRNTRGYSSIQAWLDKPRDPRFIPSSLYQHHETKRVIDEKITVEQLMQEIWQHRIPEEAKRATSPPPTES